MPTNITLVELAHRKDPSGNLATIAEVLAENSTIMQDAPWTEANDTYSHKIVRRSSLPSGTWRTLNKGVTVESSQTREFTEGIGMLEAYAETDVEIVNAAPNPAAFRMQEASAFMEGMAQTFSDAFFYGNSNTDPEKFSGLDVRTNALAATTNVIGAGGTGSDLTSIYIVQWGLNEVFMVYPKGSTVGLSHQDMGEVTVTSATSTRPQTAQYQAYRDHFQMKAGLVLKNPWSIARLANIESTGTSNIFDEDDVITLCNRMPREGAGSVLYVNATVKTQMEIALKDKANVNYTADSGEGLAGVPMLRFRGMPIRKNDSITITESALT